MKLLCSIIFLCCLLCSCSQKGKLIADNYLDGIKPADPQDPGGQQPDPTPPNSGGGTVSNFPALFVASVDGRESIYEIKNDQSIVKHLEIPEHATLQSAVINNNIIYYSLISLQYNQVSLAEVYEWNTTTSELKKISQFHQGSNAGVESLALNGKDLYASVNNATAGVELYRYAANQWQVVKDIETGAVSSYPGFFKNLNGKLYFSAFKTNSGIELWTTDGNDANLVLDHTAGATSSHPNLWHSNGQKIYFTGKLNNKYNLLSINAQGTIQMEVDAAAAAEYGANPLSVLSFQDGWVGSCHHDGSGREPCSALGGSSKWKILEVQTGSKGSSPRFFTSHKGSIYFQASTGAQGAELYKTDGTTTQLIKDIVAGPTGSYPEQLWSFGEKLYFSATDNQGAALFSYDGQAVTRIKVNQKDVRNSRSLLFSSI